MLKIKKEARYILLRLIEYRLRYLESIKWTTKNDEARVAEMHRLNQVWSDLCGPEVAEELDRVTPKRG